MAAREMRMVFTTVNRAIEKLESLSIVSEVSGGKRDRVYGVRVLMEILEEPARFDESYIPNLIQRRALVTVVRSTPR